MILEELSIYISNNISKFANIAREQHWCPREAIISVRDIFHISYKGSEVFLGEINTAVSFNTQGNEKGDMEILNVSIDRDTFKIISPNNDFAREKLIDVSLNIQRPLPIKNINKIWSKVSIYYNMILDISKTTNNRHYDLFILELLRVLDNPLDCCEPKKRRGSSF